MLKKTSLILFCLFLLVHHTFACLQENRVSLDGTMRYDFGKDFNHEDWRREHGSLRGLHLYDSLWKTTHSLEDYSDYGVQLVYLKRYKEALAVFQYIENKQPGHYYAMANIGTTYELLGQDELALKWIKKAVAKNPDSHQGSEWFHVKILEAKIKGPKYWTSNFLLGTNFGKDSIPTNSLSKKELNKLAEEMYYQLKERMIFIKPQDPMMGILLFEYGNVIALAEDATSSYRVYKIAKEYGYSSELFNKRYEYAEKLQSKIVAYQRKLAQRRTEANAANQTAKSQPKQVAKPKDYTMLFLSVLALIVLSSGLALLWVKYKKKNQTKDTNE